MINEPTKLKLCCVTNFWGSSEQFAVCFFCRLQFECLLHWLFDESLFADFVILCATFAFHFEFNSASNLRCFAREKLLFEFSSFLCFCCSLSYAQSANSLRQIAIALATNKQTNEPTKSEMQISNVSSEIQKPRILLRNNFASRENCLLFAFASSQTATRKAEKQTTQKLIKARKMTSVRKTQVKREY